MILYFRVRVRETAKDYRENYIRKVRSLTTIRMKQNSTYVLILYVASLAAHSFATITDMTVITTLLSISMLVEYIS